MKVAKKNLRRRKKSNRPTVHFWHCVDLSLNVYAGVRRASVCVCALKRFTVNMNCSTATHRTSQHKNDTASTEREDESENVECDKWKRKIELIRELCHLWASVIFIYFYIFFYLHSVLRQRQKSEMQASERNKKKSNCERIYRSKWYCTRIRAHTQYTLSRWRLCRVPDILSWKKTHTKLKHCTVSSVVAIRIHYSLHPWVGIWNIDIVCNDIDAAPPMSHTEDRRIRHILIIFFKIFFFWSVPFFVSNYIHFISPPSSFSLFLSLSSSPFPISLILLHSVRSLVIRDDGKNAYGW